jgi:hypothetical protein
MMVQFVSQNLITIKKYLFYKIWTSDIMPVNCVPGEYHNFFEISPKRKDVCIDISYTFVQSNFKNSSPIVFDQLNEKNSP